MGYPHLFKGQNTVHTYSHSAFSLNLFHGQITQKSIDQMSSPRKQGFLRLLLLKSCGVWGWFIPKTFQGHYSLFSRELIFELFARETNLEKKCSVILYRSSEVSCICIRNRPRFFVQVGHETTDACIGKKHFLLY